MVKKTSKILPDFHYFVKGNNPKLLIHSGTHGDEYEVIDIVKKCIEKYEDKLPDFVFVPYVSPSAVSSKTRMNNNGSDLNRIFFSDSKDFEVQENIKAIKDYKFDLFVSFHEDPELPFYYIYDEGKNLAETARVINHNQKLQSLGVNLLNGIDDPEDPTLGAEFTNGYRKFAVSKEFKNSGMITSWAIINDIVNDTLVPEIPGKADLKTKELIVDTFFRDILLLL